jgi:hypothetical protein
MENNNKLTSLNLANDQLLHKFHQQYAAMQNLINESNAHEIVPLMMQFIDEEYPSFDQITKRAEEIEEFLGNHEPTGNR